MEDIKKLFLFLAIIALFTSGIAAPAFADDHDDKEPEEEHEEDHDDDQPKTFESECAKKLDKDELNLDGLFCQIIIALQGLIDNLETRVTLLEDGGVGEPGPKGDKGDTGDTGPPGPSSTGGSGLSCFNQNIIKLDIPSFSLDPECVNSPPLVNAGSDIIGTVIHPSVLTQFGSTCKATISGSVSDDGILIFPTTRWEATVEGFIIPPDLGLGFGISFSTSPTSIETQEVSFKFTGLPAAGNHPPLIAVLTLFADDGLAVASDSVTISCAQP